MATHARLSLGESMDNGAQFSYSPWGRKFGHVLATKPTPPGQEEKIKRQI